MSKTGWHKFPYTEKAYQYAGAALKNNWARLHRGDCEPYPDEDGLKALVDANPGLAAAAGELKAAAKAVQQAWRLYHQGEFHKAAEAGLQAGLLGYVVANKATAIYANYLETSSERKLELYEEVSARCDEQIAAAPKWPNGYYLNAYALGRYSQGISIMKALSQGLGAKIKEALTRTIKLEPKHADAHIALGAYHAEIIDKVGSLVGGLTYGANKDSGMDHFKKALALNPDSAIARVEQANGIMLMFGKSRLSEASRLYEEAARGDPKDAMERLDVEMAKAELE